MIGLRGQFDDSLSVIIPCFNQERWIANAVASALSQPHRPAEIIVVDDGSTDNSCEQLLQFGSSVRLIRQSNAGASAARNTGLAEASGNFCMFLDGDDFVEGDAFGGAVAALHQADVAVSPCVTLRSDGSRENYFRFDPKPCARDVYERWLDYYSQPPCSLFWRTDFVRSIGGWDTRVSLNDDGEFVMRAMLAEPRIEIFFSGRGVYNAHQSLSLSKSRSPKALRAEFEAMARLIESGMKRGWACEGFGRKLYVIARAAFQIEERSFAKEALNLARSVGLRGHPGSAAHQLICYALGLEMKMAAANTIHRFRVNLTSTSNFDKF